jgi:DNA polymerase type B, organellar and viral
MRFTITEGMTHDRRPTRNAARARERAANPPATRYAHNPTRFVGVDGEGVTFWEGCLTGKSDLRRVHRYVLLGVGDRQIENPDGLGWEECFEFLWSQFRTGSVAYVGFFLGYDFVQMLRGLREERARMLLTTEGRGKRQPRSDKRRMPFPVECNGWEFDILGSKRLRIRPVGEKRWMKICDTGPFFQKSFLSVINPGNWSQPIVTEEEYDDIKRNKGRRSVAYLDDDMRRYNNLENTILSRVLGALESGFQELGISLSPGQWFGPGQAASAWLKGRAITAERLAGVVPTGALEAARQSYFGGWFEIMAHGLVPGTTWEYDINSAYPAVISKLPCLEHGEWIHDYYVLPHDAPFALVRARVHGTDPFVGAMLHRDDSGNITRPHDTEGWYWQHELQAAVRAGIIDANYQVTESWQYFPCDCPPPLREVQDIYDLRLRVGKKTPLGIACKLVPNSLYGKFAQSIGTPEYGNPVYASLITATTRAMILDAIASHPGGTSQVLMVATDGVYFRTPHPSLPCSNALGQWDSARKENLCLFKPGVYWDDATRENIRQGEAPVFKARGVNARDFGSQLESVDDQFHRMALHRPSRIEWPAVTFPVSFAMVSGLQALQRNNWALAGTLVNEPTNRQSSDPSMKRSTWYWDGDLLRSRPSENEPCTPSVPYEKRFGMADPWSDESKEENGISPEGYPGDIVNEVLHDGQ